MRTLQQPSDRKYRKTHPWLTFELDLRGAGPGLWIALGEASSKCEHIAGVPLQPAVRDRLHQLYLAKGVRATTAIEGNTLSEDEVLQRVAGKRTLPPSREYLGQEVDNVSAAVNEIATRFVEGQDLVLTPDQIRNYNRLVLQDLELRREVVPGQIRTYPAVVGRYHGAPAQDCEFLLQELCGWLSQPEWVPGMHPIADGLLKAIVAHLYIACIHPFGDGNGRTARLVEFQILVSAGTPTPAAHLLSNFYNETREEYYRQLDKATETRVGVLRFIEYALRGFVDGLREQLRTIRNQQLSITWRDYVHAHFRDDATLAAKRRRDLVLDLSARPEPVPRDQIRSVSPRIAEAYGGKTGRTVSRDLNALVRMGLIERVPEGFRPKTDAILAFLPLRRPPENSSAARPDNGDHAG